MGFSAFRFVQPSPISDMRALSLPHTPLPQPLAITNLLSVSMDLPHLMLHVNGMSQLMFGLLCDYSVTLVVLQNEKMLMCCLYVAHHLMIVLKLIISLAEGFYRAPGMPSTLRCYSGFV